MQLKNCHWLWKGQRIFREIVYEDKVEILSSIEDLIVVSERFLRRDTEKERQRERERRAEKKRK